MSLEENGALRIFFLINNMGLGGAEIQVAELAKSLARRGHRVHVCLLMEFLGFEPELNQAGVTTSKLGLRKSRPTARGVVGLASEVRRFGPDIVHAHLFGATLMARVARVVAPVPVLVCTAHSPFETESYRYVLLRLTDGLGDLWTNVCKAGLDTYRSLRTVSEERSAFTPNGIDLERYQRPADASVSAIREQLGVDGQFMWLTVGSFRTEQKDYDNLIKSCRILQMRRAELGDFVVLIAGDGVLREKKERVARALGIGEDVLRFLGLREDVRELMWAADAFVLPSAWEAHPICLLEAAATALPLVATDVGDNRDIVRDGETGALVPAKNPARLASAMADVMVLPEKARRVLGTNALSLVKQTYGLETIVDGWVNRYRDLLRRK